jgi:hypothetical protein
MYRFTNPPRPRGRWADEAPAWRTRGVGTVHEGGPFRRERSPGFRAPASAVFHRRLVSPRGDREGL